MLLREGIERLRGSGSETPRLDAELLLGHAVGVDRTAILAHSEAPVGADAAAAYRARPRATGRGRARGLHPRAQGVLRAGLHGRFRGRSSRGRRPSALVELAVAEVMRRLGRDGRVRSARHRSVSPMSGRAAARSRSRSPCRLRAAGSGRRGHRRRDRRLAGRAGPRPRERGRPRRRRRPPVPRRGPPAVRSSSDAVRHRPREPAVRPDRRDGGPADRGVVRAGRGARRRAGRARRHRRLLERLPDALAPDGVALLEIGADQGEAIVELATTALPGWRLTVEPDLAGPAARGAPGAAGVIRPPIEPVEPAFPIRLIALDIDGTLVGDDLVIGPHTRDAVRAAAGARRRRLARHRPDGLERPAVRPRARADRPDRRLPGRPRPGDAAGGFDDGSGSSSSTRRCPRRSPARSWRGRSPTASTRTQPPRAVHPPRRRPAGRRLLGVPGRARGARRRPGGSIRHPVTKVIAVGEPPVPTEMAPLARGPVRGRRGRDDQPPAIPRVRRAGRLEGPGRPLARATARRAARRRRSRSATSGTTSRCSPRSVTARRCRRARGRSGPSPATSRRRSARRAWRR